MKLIYQVSDLNILNNQFKLNLSEKRIRHMKGASDYAKSLCELHKIDNADNIINMCFFHDIARDLDYNVTKELAERSDWKILNIEFDNAVLLHSPAGAQFLLENKIFLKNNMKYLEAIRKHTLWDKKESFELSFLRLCDISEYSRDFDGVEKIREKAFEDIEKAFTLSEEFRKGFN